VEALRARGTRRGFEGEGGDTAFGHARDVVTVERIEHADQHRTGLHLRQLGLARGVYLQDDLGAERGGGVADGCACCLVGAVRHAGRNACTALYRDPVALADQFLDGFRRGGNPRFAGSGFERNTDVHCCCSPAWLLPGATGASWRAVSNRSGPAFGTAKRAFRTTERACYGAAFCKPAKNQTTVLNN